MLAAHGNAWWQAYLSTSDGDATDPHVSMCDCSQATVFTVGTIF
jgi:hypothetical protein